MNAAPPEPQSLPEDAPGAGQGRGLHALAVPPSPSRASLSETLAAVLKLGSALSGLAAAALFVLPAVNGGFSAQPRLLTLTPTFAPEKAPPAPEPEPKAKAKDAAEASEPSRSPLETVRDLFARPEPAAAPDVPSEAPAKDDVVQEARAQFDGAILVLESEPPGALARVNGQEQGETPVSVGLDCLPGVPVQVEFSKRGYERAKHTALCPKDSMLKLTARLRKAAKEPRRK
jgi:hypothetical protein